jgi:hypothetical protein
MRRILREEDVEGLYSVITGVDFKEEDILLGYARDVIRLLGSRLYLPISVLSLGNLVTNFE